MRAVCRARGPSGRDCQVSSKSSMCIAVPLASAANRGGRRSAEPITMQDPAEQPRVST